MPGTPAFLDSNIFVYAHTEGPKSEIARYVTTEPYAISVQILNEFANVALRKLRLPWSQIDPALSDMSSLAALVMPITLATHRHGIAIAKRYKLQVYDGVLLASALDAGCDIVWSEDMHDGLIVEDRLTVRNPFG